ncbi:unnamed protein product [Rotaria sordida]|uniref:Amidohydrolase 3 domain-containing protein n=1 Tax=Rotaria sordida TaxID=392033 RepID=A0A814U788_9BILA|nr:unnamed protein product [Rotaria sordida]CAF1425045.1 unnamed protein product [Rotaria sordida]
MGFLVAFDEFMVIFNGNGGNPRPNCGLIINDKGFIDSIIDLDFVNNDQIKHLYPTVKVFDLKGKFIIPGLIDAHTHTSSE